MTDKLMDAALGDAMWLAEQATKTAGENRIMQTPAGLVGARDIYLVAGQIYASRMAMEAQERLAKHLIEALMHHTPNIVGE